MLELLLSAKGQAVEEDNASLAYPAGTPFKGVTRSKDFIDGLTLANAIGLTAGKPANNASGWLHFIEDTGLELYIAKKALRINVNWEQINAVYTANENKEVTINGDVYVLKFLRGVSGASDYSWERYMYNVYDGNDRTGFPANQPVWGYYTTQMLGLAYPDKNTASDGSHTICSEVYSGGDHYCRGNAGNGNATKAILGAWYVLANTAQNWYGWRPVLVKKSTIPLIPFRGEVAAADLIGAAALASAIGLTAGNVANEGTPWLMFVDNGKTFYMPKKFIRTGTPWESLDALGAVKGTKTIVIAGKTYKVRLMTGYTTDPGNTGGGEYNAYYGRTSVNWPGPGAAWASYSDADLAWNNNASLGTIAVCQEVSTQGGHAGRGYSGFFGVYAQPANSTHPGYGWRPVLELVN